MDSERTSSSYSIEQAGVTANEKITSLFQPDVLLPGQYFDDRCRKTHLEPEKRLMLAILEDAIQCFQDSHSARCGRSKRLFDEVQRWILDARGDWVFSFESICGVLELDPEYIRKGLVRWRQKELTKGRGASGLGTGQSVLYGKVAPNFGARS
jgi:hypothetical protein